MIALVLFAACRPPVETTTPEPTGDTGITPMFQSAQYCGECHPRQYEEWQQSMHAYAARSPVFDAFALRTFRDSAGEIGSFCVNCHSKYGQAEQHNGAMQAADRSPMGLEGISCDFCHSATGHDGPIGNGNILSAPSEIKYGSYDGGIDNPAHGTARSDFITSPDFCGSCHDVFKFPGLQLEEAYTEYTTSPAAAQGIRCQDCHMGPVPGAASERPWGPSAIVSDEPGPDRELASHRFVGPDYSLLDDFPYPDDLEKSATAQADLLVLIQQLLNNGLTLEELTVSRNAVQTHIDIVVPVKSLTNGHNVPTGFTSERQVWIELVVEDSYGNVVYHSGDLDSYGDLRDEHSWDVQSGAVPLDRDLANFQSTNEVIVRPFTEGGEIDLEAPASDHADSTAVLPTDATYIQRHSIEPLERREITYSIALPRGKYTITSTLHYRNFPPYVFRALHADHLIDRLHTFTINDPVSASFDG